MARGNLHRQSVHFEVLAGRSDKSEAPWAVETMASSVAVRLVLSAGLGTADSTQRRAERPRLENGAAVYDLRGSKRTHGGDQLSGRSHLAESPRKKEGINRGAAKAHARAVAPSGIGYTKIPRRAGDRVDKMVRTHGDHRHNKSRLRRMAQRLWRSKDDHRAPGSSHASL